MRAIATDEDKRLVLNSCVMGARFWPFATLSFVTVPRHRMTKDDKRDFIMFEGGSSLLIC